MGCDIHLHVEIKVNGKWEHYNNPPVQRNYALFSKMAGVRAREDITPIVVPRGFPVDASITTRIDYERMNGDAHTPSWLNQAEIDLLHGWWETLFPVFDINNDFNHTYFGYFFGNDFKITKETHKSIEDVRFVFWFDN